MSEFENEMPGVFEMSDEEGNTILVREIDNFFYNGEEYVILTDDVEEEDAEETDEPEEIDCYVMKVVTSTDENGEEMEEFVPIEDPDLEARLIEVASTKMNEEDDEEESTAEAGG